MGTKGNIRSIRFSDEIAELIDRQVGQNFTEKFENLVIRCSWELPQKEEELKTLEEEIRKKRKELQELHHSAKKIRGTLQGINTRLMALELLIDTELDQWKA